MEAHQLVHISGRAWGLLPATLYLANTHTNHRPKLTSESLTMPESLQTALQSALAASVSGGGFADTKIVVYSRRVNSQPGRVDSPRVVYANGAVLEAASPHLATRESSAWRQHRGS